jgi:hypothetical protein
MKTKKYAPAVEKQKRMWYNIVWFLFLLNEGELK